MDRTFSETLIAEWLQLDEWAVRTGVPLEAKESGGRDEADIIGLKIVGNIPRIIHIEVGSLGGSLSENIARLDAKFANNKKKLINKELGLNGTDVEQRYIATWLRARGGKRHSYTEQRGSDMASEFRRLQIYRAGGHPHRIQ